MGMSILFAPVMPFFSEYCYQNLRLYHSDKDNTSLPRDAPYRSQSVHYLMIPKPDESLISEKVETAIDLMQRVVETSRKIRDQKKLPVKLPLQEIVVVHHDKKVLSNIEAMTKVILSEVNALKLVLSSADQDWATLSCKPNFKSLPKGLISKKGKPKGYVTLVDAIKKMQPSDVAVFQREGTANVSFGENETFVVDASKHVEFERTFKGDTKVLFFLSLSLSLFHASLSQPCYLLTAMR